jgi:hypothetical protein
MEKEEHNGNNRLSRLTSRIQKKTATILSFGIIIVLIAGVLSGIGHSNVFANHDYSSSGSTSEECKNDQNPSSTDNSMNTDSSNNNAATATASKNLTSPVEFMMIMRDLWVDHIVWTRQFIVDSASDLPSVNETTHRLLNNQEDIGNAIKPFYGNDAGNKLTDLLKQHILIAADLVKAAKVGNQTAVADANNRWAQNANDIAHFLSNANPNWSEQDLRNMLYSHMNATKAEAVARLQGNYKDDIAAFDKVHKQAMQMADQLSLGIIKQFPDKFEHNISINALMAMNDKMMMAAHK